MLQCKDCEFFNRHEDGRIVFQCDPFTNIKEPECLQKWQLLRLDALFQSYQATLRWYQKLAPMQEKMFEFMRREMGDIEDADKWKYEQDDQEESKDEDIR